MTEETTAGAVETAVEQDPAVANIEQPTDQAAEKPAITPDEELKKVQAALSRRDRRIGQITAQKYQYQRDLEDMRQKLAQYEAPTQAKLKSTGAPDESQFETYGDYLKAVARYEAREALGETTRKDQENKAQAEKQAWKEERQSLAAESAAKAKTNFSDYDVTLEANADILDSLPEEIQEAFLEAENGPAAFYALAKEGSLEKLFNMTPRQAAMEIARAEIRAQGLANQKQVTKAPSPMTAVKGSGRTSKAPEEMSGKELMSHYGLR